MAVDLVLIMLAVFVGSLLALLVELMKYLYPIYLALLLLVAAGLLTLLGRVIKLTTKQEL
jgi:hypothetical protein